MHTPRAPAQPVVGSAAPGGLKAVTCGLMFGSRSSPLFREAGLAVVENAGVETKLAAHLEWVAGRQAWGRLHADAMAKLLGAS